MDRKSFPMFLRSLFGDKQKGEGKESGTGKPSPAASSSLTPVPSESATLSQVIADDESIT